MSGGKKKSGFQITSVTSDYIQLSQTSGHQPSLSGETPLVREVLDGGSGHTPSTGQVPPRSWSLTVDEGVVSSWSNGPSLLDPLRTVQRFSSSSQPGTPTLHRRRVQTDEPVGGSSSSHCSRFRVVRLGQGLGEPYRRGRWTCVDFLDREGGEGRSLRRVMDSMRHAHSLESLETVGLGRPDRGGALLKPLALIHSVKPGHVVHSQGTSHVRDAHLRDEGGVAGGRGDTDAKPQSPPSIPSLYEPHLLSPPRYTAGPERRRYIPPALQLDGDAADKALLRETLSLPSSPGASSRGTTQSQSTLSLARSMFGAGGAFDLDDERNLSSSTSYCSSSQSVPLPISSSAPPSPVLRRVSPRQCSTGQRTGSVRTCDSWPSSLSSVEHLTNIEEPPRSSDSTTLPGLIRPHLSQSRHTCGPKPSTEGLPSLKTSGSSERIGFCTKGISYSIEQQEKKHILVPQTPEVTWYLNSHPKRLQPLFLHPVHEGDSCGSERAQVRDTSSQERECARHASSQERERARHASSQDRERARQSSSQERERARDTSAYEREHASDAISQEREHVKDTISQEREGASDASSQERERPRDTITQERERAGDIISAIASISAGSHNKYEETCSFPHLVVGAEDFKAKGHRQKPAHCSMLRFSGKLDACKPAVTTLKHRSDEAFLALKLFFYSGSSNSMVAIDNKIEQAMDLVKTHLMMAVREEVEVLREQIKELSERNAQLERENYILRALRERD